jgi:hypothetical protein
MPQKALTLAKSRTVIGTSNVWLGKLVWGPDPLNPKMQSRCSERQIPIVQPSFCAVEPSQRRDSGSNFPLRQLEDCRFAGEEDRISEF